MSETRPQPGAEAGSAPAERPWRGPDERADTAAYREAAAAELGSADPAPDDPPPAAAVAAAAPFDDVSRRAFLQLVGAGAGAAALSGCVERPAAKVVAYGTPPEEVIPGRPLHFATAMPIDGYAVGLVVTSQAGRPTKVEGNPDHPASLGAAGVLEQASVLSVYDPHRARGIRHRVGTAPVPRSWEAFRRIFSTERKDGGAGLRFLLEPTTSPLVAAMTERVLARFRGARFALHAPIRSRVIDGALLAFGRPLQPIYDLGKADVVISLDADFTAVGPFHLRYARQLADRRRPGGPSGRMSRLYQIEPALSSTGTLADVRVRRRPSEVHALAAALLHAVAPNAPGAAPAVDDDRALVATIAADLMSHRGAALVIAGDHQPPVVHALALALTDALGSLGPAGAVHMVPSPFADIGGAIDLRELLGEMDAGRVDTLVVVDCNPLYDAPADLDLAAAMAKVPTRVCLAAYEHETAAACDWLVPAAHYLESWGDARAADGTLSLIQPLIAPLHGGRTVAELLSVWAGDERPPHDLLHAHWQGKLPLDYDHLWQRSLQRGVVADTTFAAVADRLIWKGAGLPAQGGPLELAFRRSPTVGDGRFANNAWLQELPHPISKLTWDNALYVSPRTALRLEVDSGDVVEVARGDRRLRVPVSVAPGHADECFTLDLGWGRTAAAEATARGVGASGYRLRTSDALDLAADVTVRKTGDRHPLAVTQEHFALRGKVAAPRLSLAEYRAEPGFTEGLKGPQPSLLPPRHWSGHQWAMTIDTSVCNGCNGCVVACQAENNIPVVGKEGVLNSREMHWLRIDRYYVGAVEEPDVVLQPMMCQHCEQAPCEYVCPVNATAHSPDGLNEMVYNRCVGTRFCSNNCPYKVRRFNWFDYVDRSMVRLQKNPNVTVRERGVMEKCTYCVQRIRAAEIDARVAGRDIEPGEVVTACQQSCPSRAITFASLSHTDSDAVRWRDEARSYDVLHELGTIPRTRYLAQIRNPPGDDDEP